MDDFIDTDLGGVEEADDLPQEENFSETEETASENGPDSFYEEPPVKAGKYRFFSVLLFILTAGGLFLGLVGNVAAWLKPSYYFGNSGLNNSLLGFFFTRIKELFTNISAIFTGPANIVFRNVFSLLAAFLLLCTVLTSLICMIVSFVSAEKAKRASVIGGTVSLLAYTLLFVWAYCVNSLAMEAFGAAAIDVPVALITLCLFIAMAVYSVMENGLKGLFGAGIYLFTIATAFAFFFPASFTEAHLALLFTFKSDPIYNTLSLLTGCALVLNLAVSVLALPRNCKGVVRTILYSAEFVLILALAVTGCGLGGTWGAAFFQNGSLLPSLVLLFASLGALLLSLLVIVAERRARSKASAYDGPYDQYTEQDSYDAEKPDTYQADHTTDDADYASDDADYTSSETSDYTAYEGDELYTSPDEEDEEESAFEELMASYIRKPSDMPAPEEREEPPVSPYAKPTAAPQPVIRPVNVYTDPSTQYTYDPFINELTPEEKDEFGDLFIACKSGRFGDLPTYKIGGDNAEFFDKVWIRYGMYDMSQSLRDKLFSYLRRYRNKQ